MTDRAAVFLDRDGVLNKAIVRDGRLYPPSSLEEVQILPGVVEACEALRQAGFVLVVVTNQPDVARRRQSRDEVERMHAGLATQVPLDEIRVCYHDDADRCTCRKPAPGMILEAAAKWRVDLKKSYMIGDRWRDIDAGRNAGCTTVYIDSGQWEPLRSPPDHVAGSLLEASQWILGRTTP